MMRRVSGAWSRRGAIPGADIGRQRLARMGRAPTLVDKSTVLASMLFTLDDAAESMERESLDVGIASLLEALDHARGALRDVIIPSGCVFT